MKRAFMRHVTPYVCGMLITVTSCYGHNTKYVDGWEISGDTYNRGLIEQLGQDIKKSVYKKINSVVVIKNNKLLIEEYYNGASREQTHNPRSVGKTFASAILGIAIDRGHISSLGQKLAETYNLPDYDN